MHPTSPRPEPGPARQAAAPRAAEPPRVVGDTALILEVPEAEPLVRPWREREDGVPAHVTVLVPFLHTSLIDDGVRRELRALFLRHPAIDVTFREIRRFPDVAYLAPEPAGAFVRLTEAVAGRWPQTPPYGGIHDEIVPHLTLGRCGTVDEPWVTGALPLTARITAVSLMTCESGTALKPGEPGERWRRTEFFPLA